MKMFDASKTRMIVLPYGEKNYDDMLSRFHTIPSCYGQTDRQTDRIAISISRVSVLTRDNKRIRNKKDGSPGYASGTIAVNVTWTERE